MKQVSYEDEQARWERREARKELRHLAHDAATVALEMAETAVMEVHALAVEAAEDAGLEHSF